MSNGFKLRKIYTVGYCLSRGSLAQKKLGWAKYRFYARSFLLEHKEKGLFLIDTGYGQSFLDATKKGFGRIYRKLIPVVFDPKDSLVNQLKRDGITIEDISYLIITHFHPDHIGALTEFRSVPWIYRQEALDDLMKGSSWQGIKKGFIPQLIPKVPKESLAVLDSEFNKPWHSFLTCNIFDNESLLLVDLPGHALGQMGIVIDKCFFVGDAVWSIKNCPNKLGLLIQENQKTYKSTYNCLKKISDFIAIIPSHNMEKHE